VLENIYQVINHKQMTSRNFFVAFLEGFVGDPIGDFSIIFEGHGVAFRLRLGFKMKVFER
jgi:hypothetical protein